MLGNDLLVLFRLLTFEMKSVSPCVYIFKTIVGLMWMGREKREVDDMAIP